MRYLTFARPVMLSLLVGLFSVTAAQQAEASQAKLGNLNQISDWKIGTVNADDGSIYCAMVSQYDKDVVLAVSRNRHGDNSIAVDFKDKVLVSGVKYSVNIEADRIKGSRSVNRDYSGSASSSNSLLIPTGDDVPLYNALVQNPRLNVATSSVQASFNIKDFKPSYAVLVDCAGGLNRDGPRVSSAPVSSVDRVDLEIGFKDRISNIETRYKDDLYLEKERSSEKIKILNDRYEEISTELRRQKNNVDVLRAQKQEQDIARRAMQDVIEEKDKEIATLRSSQREYLSVIEELTKKRQELIDREKSSEAKQRELTDLLAQQRQKVLALENQIKNQQDGRAQLAEQLTAKEREIEELYLKRKIEEERKVSDIEARSNKLAERVGELQRENRRLEGQISAAKQAARVIEDVVLGKDDISLQDIILQYQKRIADLRSDYEKQKIKSDSYKADLERQAREVARLRSENEQKLKLTERDITSQKDLERELATRVRNLEEDNRKLQYEIDSARKALAEAEDLLLKSKTDDLSDVVSKHKSRISQLESKYKSQENIKEGVARQLQEKERQITEVYEKRLDDSRKQIQDLLEREKSLTSKIRELEDENHSLEMRVVEAKRSMQDVQRVADHSKSIELTKILEENQKRIDELLVKADEQKLVERQLRQQLLEREREVALARQEAIQGKDEVISDLLMKERELTATIERLRFENARLEADIDVARKAFAKSDEDRMSFDTENFALPDIISKQVAKTSQIASSLSEAKRTYDERLRDFNRERTELRERIERLELENRALLNKNSEISGSATAKIDQVKEMESRLLEMAKQREELRENLRAQEQQNKLLEASLKAKEESLSLTDNKFDNTSEQLAQVRAELVKVRTEKNASVSKLEEELSSVTAKYDLLRSQFENRMSQLSKEHQLVAEIAIQEETVNHLEKVLKDTEQKRNEAIRAIAHLKDIERNNSDKLHSVARDKTETSSRIISNLSRERDSIVARLSNARSERDNIRKNIADALSSSSTPVKLVNDKKSDTVADMRNQLSNLEVQLALAGQQKQELSDQLEQRTREIRSREEKLKFEEQELVSVKVMFPATRQKLEEIRAQLEKVEADRISELGDLRARLKDKMAEYDALEKEFDNKSVLMPSVSKLEIELNLTENSIKKLETDLAEVSSKLDKAQQDKDAAEKVLGERQISFAEDTKVKLKTVEELAVKLDREYSRHEVNLKKERRSLEDMQEKLQEVVKTHAPVKEINAELNKQLADATKHITEVEFELQQAQTENQKLAAKIDELIEKTSPLQEYKDNIQNELIQAKAKLATMTFDLEKSVEEKVRLESQFKSQQEIMANLRKELEDNSKNVPENFRRSVELELKKEEIQLLQGELIEIKSKYTEAMQKVFDTQSQLSEHSAARSREAEGVAKQLLMAEAEIFELRKRITEMEMQVAPILMDRDRAVAETQIVKSRLTDLEAEMLSLAQEKRQLAIRLEERNQQVFALQDELARKEQEIIDLRHVLDESNKMLTEARREMNSLKPEYQSVVNDLMVQLRNKISQYDDLQNKYNHHLSAIPAISEVEAELSSNRDAILRLEQKLAEVNEERRKAQEEAVRARAALEKAYVRMENLSGNVASPAVVNQKLSNIDRTQEQQLDRLAQEKSIETAELSMKRRAREQEVEQARANQRRVVEAKMQDPKPIDKSVEAKRTVSKAEDFLNRVMSYHRPGDNPQPLPEAINRSSYFAPEPADMMAGALATQANREVNLQDLLKIAGVSLDSYSTIEQVSNNVVTQWQSGRVSGMYEQLPLYGNFRDQVNAYIDRYRTDCTAGLKEQITPSQSSKAGNIITADVECGMKDNNYANSIVFLESDKGFVSVAHTSLPNERARVRTIRDALVRNLKRVESFATPVNMPRRERADNFRLNIQDSGETRKLVVPETDELETVIIQ